MRSRVYFMQDASGDIKIGRSVNVRRRLRSFLTANPSIKLLVDIAGGARVEGNLHRRFAHLHTRREWFQSSSALLEFISRLQAEKHKRL